MSYKQMTGNIISATKVEPDATHEAGGASGVWHLPDIYDYKRGANWPEAGVENPSLSIENNFAITLYEGNATDNRVVTTGIDLANNKGLVWVKSRSVGQNFVMVDTVRGIGKQVNCAQNDVEESQATTVKSFTSTGITLGTHDRVNDGDSGEKKYVAWTFKAAPKFFDVVTYEGTGSARTVAHSLSSVPGMMLIKNLDQDDNWAVYHKFSDGSAPEDKYAALNNTSTWADHDSLWNDTAPTSSVFTVGTSARTNVNGENYVAYLFGHETDADAMITMGVYTGNGTDATTIDVGFEAQLVMVAGLSAATDWFVFDNMRGLPIRNKYAPHFAWNNNDTDASTAAPSNQFFGDQQGFMVDNGDLNTNGATYIYMAIRRPNMATITDATEVFTVINETSSNLNQDPNFKQVAGHPVDFIVNKMKAGSSSWWSATRFTDARLQFESSAAETAVASTHEFDFSDGVAVAGLTGSTNFMGYMWKRAKGFFDIVAYTGTGSARTIAHGLGVAPEMMWVKCRSAGSTDWRVFEGNDATNYMRFQGNDASADSVEFWNDTLPTASVFSVGVHAEVNGDGRTYVAYLFATVAGVSKCGRVDHSGSSTDVDCGFTSGSRLVILKRTDDDEGTADWYWWDSVNGIVAGNDPYLLMNSTAASVTNTDYIDPLASGFTITGDFTDGTYMFYAIA